MRFLHPRPRASASATAPNTRSDLGFSFVQLIVTMVISGILLGGIGFTVFSYINTARDTVLASNVAVAAEAVQTTLALNPNLRTPAANTGKPSAGFLSELTANAPLNWTDSWEFGSGEPDPSIVHIQMIMLSDLSTDPTADQTKVANSTGPVAPHVRWIVDDGDAVRVQARNADGSWACALIVLRPDWNEARADDTPTDDAIDKVEANLRGTWYDGDSTGGTGTGNTGLHNCSPVGNTVANTDDTTNLVGDSGFNDDTDALFGNRAAGDVDDGVRDTLPISSSEWNVAGAAGIDPRTFGRSVPSFD